MNDNKLDAPIEEDHPQTVKLESNAQGAEAARHTPEPTSGEPEKVRSHWVRTRQAAETEARRDRKPNLVIPLGLSHPK